MRRLFIPVIIGAVFLTACGDTSQIATTSNTVSSDSAVQSGYMTMQREGCLGCHTVDGRISSGPTLKGVAGSSVQLASGATVTADSSYLYRSIRYPNSDIVNGYHKDVMATAMAHRKELTDAQIADIIAYLDSIGHR